jgi:flagellar basal body P-ring protein FlgI
MYNKFGLLFFGIKYNPQNFTSKNYNHFMVTVTVPQFFSIGSSYVKVHR